MIRESPFALAQSIAEGTEILAIGDIHGEADLLRALLDRAAALPAAGRRVLVFTGDLVDRGPHSLAVLDLAAAARESVGADEQVNLMGNHEQMLLCGLAEPSWRQASAYELWIDNGGSSLLRECFGPDWSRSHDAAILREQLGERLVLLRGMRGHYRSGEVLFVHAGVSPRLPLDGFLAAPWEVDFETMREAEHWAWIREPFLRAGSHRGLFVCHGHTPQDGMARTGPDTVSRDRLNLDLGSGRTGRARMARFIGHGVTVFDVAREPRSR